MARRRRVPTIHSISSLRRVAFSAYLRTGAIVLLLVLGVACGTTSQQTAVIDTIEEQSVQPVASIELPEVDSKKIEPRVTTRSNPIFGIMSSPLVAPAKLAPPPGYFQIGDPDPAEPKAGKTTVSPVAKSVDEDLKGTIPTSRTDALQPVPAALANGTEEGYPITFAGSFSDSGVLDTHTIRWNFGDGTVTLGILDPTHAYGDNGTYTITLEVTDSDGDIGVATKVLEIVNVAPTVSLGPAKLVSEGELISFTAAVEDPGILDSHTFQWEFVAGTPIDGSSKMTYSYADEGKFTVNVTVTDDDGGTAQASLSVTVLNEPPVAEAGPDQTADEGQVVSFNGGFLDTGILDTHTIAWDFGDGSSSTGTLTPTHVFIDDGTFTVTLSVTDNDGDTGTDTLTVGVNNAPPVVEIAP